jgi:CBS domain-containing protein
MLANITVKDYMTSNLVLFQPDMGVYEAIRKLLDHKITGAPVVDGHGKVLGAFSEVDCLKIASNATYYEGMAGKVSEYMTTDVTTVDADTSILEAADLFSQSTLRHFPVLEDGKLAGVVSRVDILRALLSIH